MYLHNILTFNRLPFDWKDPIFYLFGFLIDSWVVYCVLTICAAVINYAVASCLMLLVFIKDLKQEADTLNAIGKTERSQTEIKEIFFNFIEFHVHVKELSPE